MSIVNLPNIITREGTFTGKAGHCICHLKKIHIQEFEIWIVYVGNYFKYLFDLHVCFQKENIITSISTLRVNSANWATSQVNIFFSLNLLIIELEMKMYLLIFSGKFLFQ